MKKQETTKRYKRGQHPNSKAQLRPVSCGNQPSGEAKSNGQIEKRKQVNVLLNAETLFDEKDILPTLIDNIKSAVENGNNRDALDLLKLFKKNETSTNVNVQGVQKIFVTQDDINEVNKHIDDVIGE